MAHLSGYGAAAVGNMLNHYSRHGDDPGQSKYRYRNQEIDADRTRLNYNLAPDGDAAAMVAKAVSSVDTKATKRTNVLSDWIVTLPKNERLKGREREFFDQVYGYLKREVGEQRVVSAWVHMDEAQPHIHFAFVPVVETPAMTNDKNRPLLDAEGNVRRDKKGTVRYERVPVLDENGDPVMKKAFGQTKLFDRMKMNGFHQDLEAHLKEYFGFESGILLDEGDRVGKALSKIDLSSNDDWRIYTNGLLKAFGSIDSDPHDPKALAKKIFSKNAEVLGMDRAKELLESAKTELRRENEPISVEADRSLDDLDRRTGHGLYR